MSVKWNEESLAKIAKVYNSRTDFKKNRSGAYKAALLLGIMDSICNHMPSMHEPWDEVSLRAEASKYKYKTDFNKGASGAYSKAIALGIIDELFPGKEKASNLIWTKEKAQKMVEGYTTLKDFRINERKAYSAIKNHNWEGLIAHLALSNKPEWTTSQLEVEAKLYNTRTLFNKGSKGAYQAAWKLGILDRICAHMTSTMTKFSDNEIKEGLLNYSSITDLRKDNYKLYDHAIRKDLLNKYGAHLTGRMSTIMWSATLLQKEALKYTSKTEFKEVNSVAYTKATSLGILKNICGHMSDIPTNLPFNIPINLIGIYMLENNGEVVYVGKSKTCIRSRISSHNAVVGREFNIVNILQIPSKADIDVLELYLINKLKPLHNKDSKSGDTLTIDIDLTQYTANKITYKRK